MIVQTSTFANASFQIKRIMSNFHPLEVVDRGSESQFQVDENFNQMILRLKG